jgi:ubiquinone/menaquinone biosynthesis C-methylase UbiE
LIPFDRSSSVAFAAVAESYERMRPSYPQEAIDRLARRLGLGPGTTVVDLGAGTGKLTRLLVPTGARVIAVEPLAEMLEQLELAVPGAEALIGSAEEIPLPDGSADAVTAASAFHWFEHDRALPEIHRVLRSAGALGIVTNGRDLADPFQSAVQKIIAPYLPDLEELGGWRHALAASPLFAPAETFEARFEQEFDPDGLAERIGTISYIARLPEDERAEVLAQVRALGEAQPGRRAVFRYRTIVTVCRAAAASTL